MARPYNPLDKKNLAHSLKLALLKAKPRKLAHPIGGMKGAGVYALYYVGSFDLYRKITERNRASRWEQPIYVGKAAPSGSRKGLVERNAANGHALRDRLKAHQESIKAAFSTLDLKDFSYRAMVVDDIWIPLAESILITTYKPIWNTTVDGFGNNAPGKGRKDGKISPWDTLHPGREWAAMLTGGQKYPVEEVIRRVTKVLA